MQTSCTVITTDIQTIKEYAKELKNDSRIDQQVLDIEKEYESVKELLQKKEKVLSKFWNKAWTLYFGLREYLSCIVTSSLVSICCDAKKPAD